MTNGNLRALGLALDALSTEADQLSLNTAIGRTIQLTDAVLLEGALPWATARLGAIEIINDLCSKYPAHTSMIKAQFTPWIHKNDALYFASESPADLPAHCRVQTRLEPQDLFTRISSNASADPQAKVENFSRSGAKLRTSARFEIGTEVFVGQMRAVVIRQAPGGVACRFRQELSTLSIDWADWSQTR